VTGPTRASLHFASYRNRDRTDQISLELRSADGSSGLRISPTPSPDRNSIVLRQKAQLRLHLVSLRMGGPQLPSTETSLASEPTSTRMPADSCSQLPNFGSWGSGCRWDLYGALLAWLMASSATFGVSDKGWTGVISV